MVEVEGVGKVEGEGEGEGEGEVGGAEVAVRWTESWRSSSSRNTLVPIVLPDIMHILCQ